MLADCQKDELPSKRVSLAKESKLKENTNKNRPTDGTRIQLKLTVPVHKRKNSIKHV